MSAFLRIMRAPKLVPKVSMSLPAFQNIDASVAKGGVFALGNFDGVHLGHKAVISAALEKARNMGVPARVLTLEPHPRSLFKPHIPPFRLTPAPAKTRLLKALGIEDVVVIPFTKEFADLPAHSFVDDILLKTCGAQHAIAGFDFVFGHNRAGDMKNLRAWLAPHNIGVTEVTPFRDAQGEIMSSSRTREALQAGDLKTAEHILGRPWSISGIIQKGDQRGRQMSVPTANIALGDHLRPKFGVYAVNAGRVGQPASYHGVANI
ncbi:MAG TPA: riboflavin biosynthesis protein RibF, partial [Alphaproteobacteria bacterium]|nr:riboflavin biosynthesis protein RibF [Alphaproteobacteria bacterium]